MTITPTRRAILGGIPAAVLLAGTASAQDAAWPQRRPIQWVLGFAPGGALDATTRVVAEKLSRAIGQQVVVENRTGASGAIAARAVAQAAPDGYTLISLPGPILYPQAVPGPGRGLTPVTLLALGPMVIAGPAAMGLNSLAQVIEQAKREPDKWNFGTAGVGSSHHIAGELLNERAGTRIQHIPYRGGGGPLVQDLLAGRLSLAVVGAGPLLPHIQAGTVRAYAVTTAQRFPELPEVPTLVESGFADIDLGQWFGTAVPTGTPPAIVARLNQEISRIVREPDTAALLRRQGMQAAGGPAEQFGALFAREEALYADLVKRFAIALE